MTRSTHQLRENGVIIAGAGPDMGDAIADLDVQFIQQPRMQRRAAIVDALVGLQGEQRILIGQNQIGGKQRAISATQIGDLPWRRTEEFFARHDGKGGLDRRVRRSGGCRHLMGVGPADHCNFVGRERRSRYGSSPDFDPFRLLNPLRPRSHICRYMIDLDKG